MNTKILIKLGQTLKDIRKNNGITQEQLAEMVNVHPTYIGKIESGKNNLSIKLLFRISRALKVKLSDIFEFDK